MFGLGVPELVLIAFIVILFFGGSRLPALGRAGGATLREFREGLKGSSRRDAE